MTTMRVFTSVCLFSMVVAMYTATPAWSHHLWVEKSGGAYVVARGILSERNDAYNPDCVKAIRAYGSDGRLLAIERKNTPQQVRFTAASPVAMAAVTSHWGYRVKTTRGKKFMTRAQAVDAGLNVLSAFFSTHCSKSLFHAVDPIDRPVGLKFEIVPLVNPFRTAKEAFFKVKLLFDKKPLPGAFIYLANGRKSATDSEGVARIPWPEKGTLLIYSRHWIDAEDRKDVDRLVFMTFLTVGPGR